MVRLETIRNIAIILVSLDIYSALYAIINGGYPESLPGGGDPTSYLILYLHVPVAWNLYLGITIGMVASILYLWRGLDKYDVIAYRSIILGLLFGFSTIATGMIWANEVWGEPWSWDPRQTSVLVLILAYIGYIALRHSISDPDRMKVFSSSYAVAAYITLPLSYVSAIIFRSLHVQLPSQPLTIDIYILLFVRVLIALTTFISLLYLYYKYSILGGE